MKILIWLVGILSCALGKFSVMLLMKIIEVLHSFAVYLFFDKR